MTYQRTNIWRSSLAQRDGDDADELSRSRLREGFVSFRRLAEQLAGEIPIGIRELTVHDVPNHIDALWQIADIIVGQEYRLTPLEAYVLGGAFLLHDLGLALASYPNGIDDLKKLSIWRDSAAQYLRQKSGSAPFDDELSNLDAEATQAVLESVLRQNHARAAANLGLHEYQYGVAGDKYFLIEDADLRKNYAQLIGIVAYSHWWPVERLPDEFSQVIGSFPGTPHDWVVDPLKLACILRVADACHIDGRRAPGFLRALRKPSGIADKHWRFQDYVQTPHFEKQRLVFSVSKPLPVEDADAWWIGYELIQTADRELRDVDMILRDSNRQPFAVHGIAGANDPVRLRKYIRTDGWEPVSTEIGVSNVAALVRKLGGAALYGKNPKVPLRELLQNARDAIVARRAAEERDASWGRISVKLIEDGDQDCVEVHDNGIGMSQKLLCGPFLDFGTSYWHTPLMMEEHSGLSASRFEPQGRFGIGFFAVFMWGDRVKITTRSIHEGPTTTRVLEFTAGLSVRPLLRPATDVERLSDPGTVVRVWLDKKAKDKDGFLAPQSYPGFKANLSEKRKWTLSELCEWLCPAIDVDVQTDEKGANSVAILANDWKTIDSDRLMYRLVLHATEDASICEEPEFKKIAANVRPIVTSDGQCLGRAAFTLKFMFDRDRDLNAPFPLYQSTVGVFRGWDWNWGYIAGLLIGNPTRASRDWSHAIALDRLDALGDWATEQMSLVENELTNIGTIAQCALAIRGFGGDTGDWPIGRDSKGFFSYCSLAARGDLPDELELWDDHWGVSGTTFRPLAQNQLAVSTGFMRQLQISQDVSDPQKRANHPTWERCWMSLWAATIEAISLAWRVPLQDVLECSQLKGGWRQEPNRLIPTPDVIRNPRSLETETR